MNNVEHPIIDSYQAAPMLYAGIHPAKAWDHYEKNITDLIDAGVRCFINLTEIGEYDAIDYAPFVKKIAAERGLDVQIKRIPIEDMNVPSADQMIKILDVIDQAQTESRPVYVHCYGGRGRTGTVIGCYLVRHGFNGREALERVEELRRGIPSAQWPSPDTREQATFVENWLE